MTNLTPEQLALIMAAPSYAPTVDIGGQAYQAARMNQSVSGENDDNRYNTDVTQILGYDPAKTEKGKDLYSMYDPEGKFTGQGMFKDDDAAQMFALFLAAGLGMGFGLPALMGGEAAGMGAAGAAAGGAGTGAAEALAAEAALGAGAGAEGLGALGSLGSLSEAGAGMGELGSSLSGGLDTSLLSGSGFTPNSFAGISGLGQEAAGFSGLANQGVSFGGLNSANMFSGLSPDLASAALGASNAPPSWTDMLKDKARSLLSPSDSGEKKDEGIGLNLKTAAAALPLIGTLAGGQKPETPSKPALTPEQQEYMNRSLTQWDWDKIQRDAQAAGMGTGAYVARNWPRITSGEYNKVALARGGALSLAVGGPGTGRSDSIPARLSDGEYIMDAETVAMLGDGSTKAGAQRLDQMRHGLRAHKGKAMAQGRFSPNAKSPLAYLAGAK